MWERDRQTTKPTNLPGRIDTLQPDEKRRETQVKGRKGKEGVDTPNTPEVDFHLQTGSRKNDVECDDARVGEVLPSSEGREVRYVQEVLKMQKRS